jgi:putative ABC transport system permease protein
MNLAVRDIRHNLVRFILTCVGLALLLGVVLSMIGIYRGLVSEALTLIRSPAVNLWVVEAHTRGPFAEASRIPGDTQEAIARMSGVLAAGSVTYQSIDVPHGDRRIRLYLIGYELGRLGGPHQIAIGRNIARGRFEVVSDLSAGLRLGERIRLGRDTFTVVGLTKGLVSSGGDPVAFISLRDSQKLQFDLAPPAVRRELARGATISGTDIVNAVVVRLSPNLSPDTVAADIRRWKHLSALTQEQQETVLAKSVIERARRQIGLFTSILLTVSTVIIALIIYTLTIDKMRDIATLKLIGAPNTTIVGLIVQQALAMGIIGFAVGASLIVSVKDYFPRRVLLQPEDAMGLGLVVMIVCVLASGLGVRLALKVDPSAALGG